MSDKDVELPSAAEAEAAEAEAVEPEAVEPEAAEPEAAEPEAAEPKSKLTLKEKLQEHLAEYGATALVIYFSISALTILGFYVAIKSGMDIGDSAAGSSGTLVAAWVAAKITLPLRIGATFLLTPIAAAIIHKLKGRPKS